MKCSEETEWNNIRHRGLSCRTDQGILWHSKEQLFLHRNLPLVPTLSYTNPFHASHAISIALQLLRFTLQILPITEEFYFFSTSKYIHNRTVHQGQSTECKALTFRKMCRSLYRSIKLHFNIILPTIPIFPSVALSTISTLAISSHHAHTDNRTEKEAPLRPAESRQTKRL